MTDELFPDAVGKKPTPPGQSCKNCLWLRGHGFTTRLVYCGLAKPSKPTKRTRWCQQWEARS